MDGMNIGQRHASGILIRTGCLDGGLSEVHGAEQVIPEERGYWCATRDRRPVGRRRRGGHAGSEE